MLIKNISERSFNLESGVLMPGSIGKATFTESKLLLAQGLAVMEAVSKTDALGLLKFEADTLGIIYHPMIKAASLQKKIDEVKSNE